MRTREEWIEVCKRITVGPVAGSRKKEGLYDNAEYLVNMLLPFELWKDGDYIVEIGSGNGRFPMGLCDRYDVRYTGIEIIRDCVDYCNEAFAPYPSFDFCHIDAVNQRYWSVGSMNPEAVKLPIGDSCVNLVIMLSVMTHIEEPVVVNYIAEAYRVFKPHGIFLTTWFRSPPNVVTNDPARTVYSEDSIRRFLDKFHIEQEIGGDTTDPNDQWMIKAIKPE